MKRGLTARDVPEPLIVNLHLQVICRKNTPWHSRLLVHSAKASGRDRLVFECTLPRTTDFLIISSLGSARFARKNTAIVTRSKRCTNSNTTSSVSTWCNTASSVPIRSTFSFKRAV